MLRTFEVLAPAKNLEYGIQAVKCGADAVYIACDKFGLRNRCSNSVEDIKKLIEFAHRYWVRVYVTLNSTIYTEKDFKYIRETIIDLYKSGADAVIISDMGILTLDLPPIPLFASVNTKCLTADKINFLTKVGIKRVILPRELSLKEIQFIGKHTNVPLEAFIHGTMCVAYSGNCYFKYAQMIKNTQAKKELLNYQYFSSNNGACVTNCTHYYNLLDADGNYIVKNDTLLHIHYLNLLDKLEPLFKAGITSFKIEGRQRELSYLKNIVALVNKKANEVLKKNKKYGIRFASGTSVIDFEPNLNKVFNRGFTEYFFNGRKSENLNSKGIYGTYIGKVKNQRSNVLDIATKSKLAVGDRFLCSKENTKSEIINIVDIKNNKYVIDRKDIKIKDYKLYRIVNAKAITEIENAFTYRYLSTKLTVSENGKTKYKLTLTDEDNITAFITCKKDFNVKISKDTLLKKFNTDKEYEFQIIDIKAPKNINLKEEDLLKIRENLYLKLRAAREKARSKEKGKIKNNTIPYPNKDITSLDNVVNARAVKFYKQHGVKNIEYSVEHNTDIKDKKIWNGRYCIRYEQGYCSKKNRKDTPKMPWYLEDKFGNKYKLQFDCNKCEMSILG